MKILPLVALVVSIAACTSATSPPEPAKPAAVSASASASASAPAPASAPASASASASASAPAPVPAPESSDAGADAADAAPAVAFVADNKILPALVSDELTARAKLLFEAIVADDASKAESFWFPKEPFIPLKDVKGPDKYWEQLHRTYGHDIHALHKKRKSWEGATFVGFEMGSTPKWVPPGDEANKIGYYRSFRGKLKYDIEGKTHSIEVRTLINWQNQWFITHLSKFKK